MFNLHDILIFGIPLKGFIADLIAIIAIPTGIAGIILIIKDWLYRIKHEDRSSYKNYHD